MADARGAVGRLGGGDRRGAVLDAVDELAPVPRAFHPDFAGFETAVVDRGRGRLVPAAVDPDPVAVLADPLRAVADFLDAAGDGHLHAVRVRALHLVALRRVEDAVLAVAAAPAFEGHRAGRIRAKPPLRNVAVVADPVHELPAAPVGNPAPIPVAHALVGTRRRGADPEIPVETVRHRCARNAESVFQPCAVPARQTNFDARDLADASVPHQLDGAAHLAARTLPAAGLPHAAVALDGADEGASFAKVVGEGLFAEDVLAAVGGEHADGRVPVVRRGDEDGVDVVAAA